MGRTKLSLPSRELFHTLLDVRVEHINYGGHMGNDKFLSFAHQARVQFLQSLGATELDFYEAGLIMLDACLNYRAEVFLGDQLSIALNIEDIQHNSFDIVMSLKTQDKLAAIIKTTMCFFDYQQRKIVPTPQAFKDRFSSC